jgi:protein-disulfide isomerase
MSRQQRRSRQRRASESSGQRQGKWLWWTASGLAGAVFLVVVVLFAGGVFGSDDDSADLSKAQVDELVSQSHLIGQASAPVTLIEFADFQCPFCRQFWATTLPAIESEFIETGRAALHFHQMAFIGPESELAAQASECAAEQGRFEDYHDALYQFQGPENEGYLTEARLESFASMLEMDVSDFSGCLASRKYLSEVRADTDSAGRAGVNSTPTLAVNGNFVGNPLDVNEVRQAILSALGEAG